MILVFRLLEVEFKNSVINIIRYPLNFLSGAVVLSLFFLGLFFGASYLAGGVDFFKDGRVESSLVSFIAWTLTITCLSSLSNDIQKEAAQGTLEHIVASKRSFLLIMLVRLVVTIFVIFLLNGLIFTVLTLVTRSQFNLSWSILVPITCIAISASGLGLILGALTLVYKQVSGLINMIQFLILPAFFISYSDLQGSAKYLVSLLPCLSGMEFARNLLVMSVGNPFNSYWFFAALANSAVWLCLGMIVFQLSLRRARRKGLLNEY
ncbi:MAG: hypothetical protein ACRC80_09155 [Waterburya sp.]